MPSSSQLDKIIDSLGLLITMQVERDQREQAAFQAIQDELTELRNSVAEIGVASKQEFGPISVVENAATAIEHDGQQASQTVETETNVQDTCSESEELANYLNDSAEPETESVAEQNTESPEEPTAADVVAPTDALSEPTSEPANEQTPEAKPEPVIEDRLLSEVEEARKTTFELESTIETLTASLRALTGETEEEYNARLNKPVQNEQAINELNESQPSSQELESSFDDASSENAEPIAPSNGELSPYEKYVRMMAGDAVDEPIELPPADEPTPVSSDEGSAGLESLSAAFQKAINDREEPLETPEPSVALDETEQEPVEVDENLERLKEELKQKLRSAEIQLSIQRVKLEQQKAQLEEREAQKSRVYRRSQSEDAQVVDEKPTGILSRLKNHLGLLQSTGTALEDEYEGDLPAEHS